MCLCTVEAQIELELHSYFFKELNGMRKAELYFVLEDYTYSGCFG